MNEWDEIAANLYQHPAFDACRTLNDYRRAVRRILPDESYQMICNIAQSVKELRE